MVRHSLKYVSWKMRKVVAADLRTIYAAATMDEAQIQLQEFDDKCGGCQVSCRLRFFAGYDPETWEALQESILKQPVISANELEIVKLVREANVVNPKVRTNDERERILGVINTLKPDNASADD